MTIIPIGRFPANLDRAVPMMTHTVRKMTMPRSMCSLLRKPIRNRKTAKVMDRIMVAVRMEYTRREKARPF